jgi:S-formylglutathione hydrolase FrmB
MALIHCNFFSEVLGLSCSMDVILPQATTQQIGMAGKAGVGKHPVLWLLHGLSDDHTIWQRRTSIERYVAELGLAVVMPAVDRSFYVDARQGKRFGTYIADELPALARSFFPLSDRRQDNFVAGLSMGGYGAFRLALAYPERYGAAASLSGCLDIAASSRRQTEPNQEWRNIFGPPRALAGSPNDLLFLARQVARAKGPKPKLFQCCGIGDFLYQDNLVFRDHALKLSLDLTYEEGPGVHDWAYWDTQIQHVLAWLPLAERPK